MKLLQFLGFIFLLVGCGSNPKFQEDNTFNNEYLFLEDKDSIVIYAIVKRNIPVEKEALSVEKIIAELSGKESGKEIQSAVILNNIFSGSYPVSATEKTCLFVYKGKLYQKGISDQKFDFYITSNYGKLRKSLPKSVPNISKIVENMEFLKLIPVIEETDNSTLTFKMLCIRQAPHQGAYLPSSENFRIEIINAKDGKRWNSSEGMMFMQAIGEIKPTLVGTEEVLSLEYKINQKEFRLNGQNTVNFMIPAKPHLYQTSTKYWKK